MPNFVKITLFLFLLPFLCALSHDIYINYFSTPEKVKKIERLQINFQEFEPSDAGWVWQKYSTETFDMARTNTSTATWKHSINPILQLETMLVAIIPFACLCAIFLLCFLIGIWPFPRGFYARKRKDNGFSVYKGDQGSAVKFKRK